MQPTNLKTAISIVNIKTLCPAIFITTLLICGTMRANSQFKGGVGQGSTTFIARSATMGSNIFAGGIDDGHTILKTSEAVLGDNIFKGGIDDGHTVLRTSEALLGDNIFKGGIDDGHTVLRTGEAALGDNIFKGGVDDGHTVLATSRANMGSNIFAGGADDGWAMAFNSRAILPVTLQNFTGQWQKADARLTWQTLTETNTAYFILERSFNATTFTAVTKIAAAGQSAVLRSYNYIDVNVQTLIPQGSDVVYYRLHTFDKDGKAEYSGIVALHTNAAALPDYAVFPNPASSYVTVTTTAPVSTEKTYIRIADASGKVLVLQQMSSSTQQIPVSRYANGLYYLQLITASKVLYTQKIIINK